jgi:hypothetical protein
MYRLWWPLMFRYEYLFVFVCVCLLLLCVCVGAAKVERGRHKQGAREWHSDHRHKGKGCIESSLTVCM